MAERISDPELYTDTEWSPPIVSMTENEWQITLLCMGLLIGTLIKHGIPIPDEVREWQRRMLAPPAPSAD